MKIDIQSLRGLDAHRSADAELAARLTELNAEADGRPFSEAQKAEFDEILATREQLAAIIEELELRDQAVASVLEEGERHTEAPVAFHAPNIVKVPDDIHDLVAYRQRVRSVDELPQAYRDGAMRFIEKANFPTAKDQDVARDRLAEIIDRHADDDYGVVSRRILGTTSKNYQEAWAHYVTGGFNAVPNRLQAALQTYSDADGGVAIPVTIDPTFVLTTDGAVNPLREGMARIETITTKKWEPVTTGGVTAAYAAETAAAADGAPADAASPGITPLRAHVLVGFTAEYNEDYGPAAIQAEVGRLIRDSKNVLEADKFVNGAGTTEPKGVVTAVAAVAGSVKASATAATFALVDIDKLEGELGDRFIANAQWLAARKIYQTARGFGTAGQPANSIYDAMSRELRGYPARVSNAMDKTTATNDTPLLFGDFSYFVIVDRLGLSTEFIPQIFDGSGQPLGRRGIYARWRNSSDVLTANAFRLLKIA